MKSRSLFSIQVLALACAFVALAGKTFAAGPEKILYSFQGPNAPSGQDGEGPSDLIAGEHGNLYGVTTWGGICNLLHHLTFQCGTVFELSPPATAGGSWTETILYEFGTNALDGEVPLGIIRDKQGNLFGVTEYSGGGYAGGYGCGNFFELSPPAVAGGAWTETILYNFLGGDSDGCGPLGSLVSDSHGDIFGSTSSGGGQGKTGDTGGIFEISPPSTSGGSWTEAFTSLGGLNPSGGLAIDQQGILYGTTSYSNQIVFQLVPPTSGGTWVLTTLYSFLTDADGTSPGGVTLDHKGNIYGVTYEGGTANYGTIFLVSPPASGSAAWTKRTLYSFQGGTDGAYPLAAVTFNREGNLFGTTSGGGDSSCTVLDGCGTVFEFSHDSGTLSEKVLYRFQGSPDGYEPDSGVFFVDQNLYGATTAGGTDSYGAVFEVK